MASRSGRGRTVSSSSSRTSTKRTRSGSSAHSSSQAASSKQSTQNLEAMRRQLEKMSAAVSSAKAAPPPEPTINCEYLGILGMTHSQAKELFGGTKVVLLCGPSSRAHRLAHLLQSVHLKWASVDQIGSDEYFTLIKVGSVLVSSHGMGASSALILLNELWTLLRVALPSKTRSTSGEFCMVRIGSSGGIGVEAGTLVLSTEVLNNETLRPEWLYFSCGQRMSQPCRIDVDCTDELYCIAKSKGVPAEQGKSMSTDDYYESQARLDGALCEFDRADQSRYMRALFERGVRNIEMEGTVISGFCTKHQIPFAMIAVAYLDRLKVQTVSKEHSKAELEEWMERALRVAVAFAAKHSARPSGVKK